MEHQQEAGNGGTTGEPRQRRRPPPQALLRRYKWGDLSVAEKQAVNDALGLAAIRSGVGLGGVLTATAIVSNIRRSQGSRPLPTLLRYGSIMFFSVAGMYGGFMSGGPIYARRILSVPNSRLADDLRTVMEDWRMRGSATAVDVAPHEPLPEGPAGTGRGKTEVVARDPREVRREERARREEEEAAGRKNGGSWTRRIGLTK